MMLNKHHLVEKATGRIVQIGELLQGFETCNHDKVFIGVFQLKHRGRPHLLTIDTDDGLTNNIPLERYDLDKIYTFVPIGESK